MFILNSDITIGTFQFRGVNEVRVIRSLHSYADTAYIKVPSICKIIKGKRSSPVILTTASQFKERDAVTITLGYNGDMVTVFKGFVKRKGLGMPLEVECEGYVQKLRLDIDVSKNYATTKASELLNLLKTDKDGKSTGINIVVKDDLPFINVSIPHRNGVEICDAVKRFSERTLNIFFINPNTLWCGLTYTPYSRGEDPFGLGTVDFKLGYNVIKDNSLKERVTDGERVEIIFGGTLASGVKVKGASDDKTAKRKQKSVLNHVGELDAMRKMAREKQYTTNYAGYEGSINSFLQPYCAPGWVANIEDARYPERNGKYMIESTEITFGQRGARIKVEIGPLLGFKPNP